MSQAPATRAGRADALLVAVDSDDAACQLAEDLTCLELLPLDPEAGAESQLEERLLLVPLGASPLSAKAPDGLHRLGWTLTRADGHPDALAYPRFAADLAEGVRPNADELWILDLSLWSALSGDTSLPELARIALRSPGRRVLTDLAVLGELPDRLSPLSHVFAAAGVDAQSAPPDWHVLHDAIPTPSSAWAPAGNDVAAALHLLESEHVELGAGAALGWLLNRAMDEPGFVVGDRREDLREHLPLRLSGAPLLAAGAGGVAARYEAVVLAHAARICREDTRPGAARRCWTVARWLHRLLARSPFYGGDLEVLTIRLEAMAPPELPGHADPLHPTHFASGRINLHDACLLAAIARHYARPPLTTLRPMPELLRDALRAIAAKSAPHQHSPPSEDALGWCALLPQVQPPLAARLLLSHVGVPWISGMPDAVLAESAEWLVRSEDDPRWLVAALLREPVPAKRTGPFVRVRREGSRLDAVTKAMLGVAVWDALDDAEHEAVVSECAQVSASWAAWLLAEVATRAGADSPHRSAALSQLFSVIQAPDTPADARLTGAMNLARNLDDSAAADASLLEKLVNLLGEPPFAEHLGLRRELRRLGRFVSRPVALRA